MTQEVEAIAGLFQSHAGRSWDKISALPLSGSNRRYYRIVWDDRSCIAVWHEDLRENRLFVDFSRHFKEKGLPVPEVYGESVDGLVYLQEDLGETMLLDVVERGREGGRLSPELVQLYKEVLEKLLRLQLTGGEGWDYSGCLPRPEFDRTCIFWDLNYFKYCFLRLAGITPDEVLLEEDFNRLADQVECFPRDSFMFRDFQSRNIMIRDSEIFFIDYQGGRKGALPYDVASLLYDAIVALPDIQREELLEYYISLLQQERPEMVPFFRQGYNHFVLLRLLQAMGAFGLRGLYEEKEHFIISIAPGLQNILSLFVADKLGGFYPEIERTIRLAACKFVK